MRRVSTIVSVSLAAAMLSPAIATAQVRVQTQPPPALDVTAGAIKTFNDKQPKEQRDGILPSRPRHAQGAEDDPDAPGGT